MTIQRTLLGSYLLIGILCASLISLLIFIHFKQILRLEIEHKLTSQAGAIMQQIDTTLFERMENIFIWSQLAVMQDVRSDDIDKRLSQFLHKLQLGYSGVYQQLFVTNQKQYIIAASSADLIGNFYPKLPPWLMLNFNHLSLSLQSLTHQHLYFSIPIADAFQSGQLGQLYAEFDWREIQHLLDAPLPFNQHQTVAYAMLIDQHQHILAMSSELAKKNPIYFKPLSNQWQFLTQNSGSFEIRADFLKKMPVLVGYAHSQGYRHFKGLGWKVLIIQPREQAFLPIMQLWWLILIFLTLTLLLAISLSLVLSSKIAKPISQLAQFSHDFMHGKQVSPPTLKASDEINELSLQFNQMIANLEQSRQHLIRVSKLAVIGEMAASMAHEVRTPLGILRSSAQILQREPQLTEIGLEMTGFILSETERLNGLVTTLLECAKPRPPQFKLQVIHPIIEHSIELLQVQLEKKQIQLQFNSAYSNLLLNCDRDQIIQILLNLLLNAIQQLSIKGQILILLQTLTGTHSIEIQIHDNGQGIADKDKQQIFEPFFTRRQEGIGLGLTVVQQIVLAHHGNIFVTNSQLGGACFHLQFP